MIKARFSDQDDLTIWKSFKGGNREAFAYMYDKHVKLLFLYGKKISDDIDLIEDCIHDTFVEIWTSRSQLSETDSIKRYLFKILRRKITKAVQSKYKTQNVGNQHDLKRIVDELTKEESMIRQDVNAERYVIVRESLRLLTNRQREILYLRYFEGLDYEEIADIIDINLQSAKNIVHRALVKIREQLSKEKISKLLIFLLFVLSSF
ncbi:sigma-70 family RNA polymerase sigma factor [Fulvivirgaceae bacterium BMA10]|uniref:Sigma-70 family RNA polymerase sigma factor n=1 Tax=Splendidivirga corallicola TaxID=3051826 RepID=A0ABT8KMZ3_9BACT|nr:sigma-70 family RNA polymerase sigma factor [Fulvivirgaceae bacterium BMA10]